MGPLEVLFSSLGVIGAVLLLRKIGKERLAGDFVGAILAFVVAYVGAVAQALQGNAPLSGATFAQAAVVALAAMGGWSGVWKRILLPLAAKYAPGVFGAGK